MIRSNKPSNSSKPKSFGAAKSNFLYPSEMFDFESDRTNLDHQSSLMEIKTMKRLSLIFIWILKHLPISIFSDWLCRVDEEKRNQLVTIMFVILDIFDLEVSFDLLN